MIIESLLNDWVWRAVLGSLGLAIPASIVGCFLLWRRAAFFGDAVAHIGILGVVLGYSMHISTHLSVICVSCILVAMVGIFNKKSQVHGYLSLDVRLAIISYVSMALALVFLQKTPTLYIEPESILFGDILSISRADLLWILAVNIITITFCLLYWRMLMLLTIHTDLATVRNVPVHILSFFGLMIMAFVVAIGVKIAGALLMPALMIIPAATVSKTARSPQEMVWMTCVVTIIVVSLGLGSAFYFDLIAGPSMTLCAMGLFLIFRTFMKR